MTQCRARGLVLRTLVTLFSIKYLTASEAGHIAIGHSLKKPTAQENINLLFFFSFLPKYFHIYYLLHFFFF